MQAALANTIWAPAFLYFYDSLWSSCAIAAGFFAEYAVFRGYMRGHVAASLTFSRLVRANVASFAVGVVFLALLPLDIRKNSLGETTFAFWLAYSITLPVEYYVLRRLLPESRALLFRSVAMANFISYAILFGGFVLWFRGLHDLLRIWRDVFWLT
jgi:hypothetical protein